ncbi:MAG: hypothetical protein ACLPSF_08580 [Methylocella sp.]
MQVFDGSNRLPFFKALYRSFSATLSDEVSRRDPIESLLQDCFETFERNSENAAGVVCHGGCASCCAIRVAATAPEILLIARAAIFFGNGEVRAAAIISAAIKFLFSFVSLVYRYGRHMSKHTGDSILCERRNAV